MKLITPEQEIRNFIEKYTELGRMDMVAIYEKKLSKLSKTSKRKAKKSEENKAAAARVAVNPVWSSEMTMHDINRENARQNLPSSMR